MDALSIETIVATFVVVVLVGIALWAASQRSMPDQ